MFDKKSWLTRYALAFALAIVACASFSKTQSANPARPATSLDLDGTWQLVPLPAGMQSKLLGVDPKSSECEWFVYQTDGAVKGLNSVGGACSPLSVASAQADNLVTLANVPVSSWKFGADDRTGEGYVQVGRADDPRYQEIWQADILRHDVRAKGIAYKQGDLVLTLVDPNTKQALWYRHLRRVSPESVAAQ